MSMAFDDKPDPRTPTIDLELQPST